jgi:hypothetical protein
MKIEITEYCVKFKKWNLVLEEEDEHKGFYWLFCWCHCLVYLSTDDDDTCLTIGLRFLFWKVVITPP